MGGRVAQVRTGIPAGRKISGVLALLAALPWGCTSPRSPSPDPTAETMMQTFELRSDDFAAGAAIPARYTCDGNDVPPALTWDRVPEGTAGFTLIVTDPDAPRGEFTHWVLFNIPGDQRALSSADAKTAGVAGRNDFGRPGYGGPCPPHGHGRHRYVFTLYALDRARLDVPNGATRKELEHALQPHVVGRAQLVGTYER